MYAFLIREAGFEEEIAPEIGPMSEYFAVRRSLDEVQPGDELFARFALKPFYEMQAAEIEARGASLIVPADQHAWIEDLGAWYELLSDVTPKTWFSLDELDADGYAGPYFVKGRTYSRKHDWNTHAFAADRTALDAVIANIKADALYGADDLVIRQFVPLKTYGYADRGLPITCEHRYFILDGQVASSGYYWSSYGETVPDDRIDERVVDEVVARLHARGLRWCVADFALTEDGQTILIELNDPSMTGLSANDPAVMYAVMAQILKR